MILTSRYESNLKELSEKVQKVHDLKKASVGRIQGDILRYYP